MQETVKVLVTAQEIEKRLDEIVAKVSADFEGQTITLICVLKGGVIFMVDLSRKLSQPVEFDFLDISSYGSRTESSGIVKIDKDLKNTIAGKHVLLVEDIIDSGRTLSFLRKHLLAQQPACLKVCTLLDKPSRRVVEVPDPDYVGFVIPDEFVVGYGLDYDQRYRNLPYIGVLSIEE